MQRRWPWIVGFVLLTAAIVADRAGLLFVKQPDDMAVYHGRDVPVSRVINPHTIEVDLADALHGRSATRVRLWGLDAPRLARPGRPAEPLATEAFALTEAFVLNRMVTLRLESHRTRDAFGRVLAHVDLPDGGTLNEALLEAGLARVNEHRPHGALTAYAHAERRARSQSIGLWAPDVASMPREDDRSD